MIDLANVPFWFCFLLDFPGGYGYYLEYSLFSRMIMKKIQFKCPFCDKGYEDEASSASCFVDPATNYSLSDLMISKSTGRLYRVSKLDKRRENISTNDVDVEEFIWKDGAWVYGKPQNKPVSFWCDVRRCTPALMRDKIESTKKLLVLEEMLLAHMDS